ncbi:archaellin/type IV pilin N-terminal domain-containing protein [Aeropyrum camini]|uniref:archaellin/type IV pilin N-terminal domain-containing protein n=1 Tax=Aeropyrum camini TaxID=229980 RepID=UPI0030842A40
MARRGQANPITVVILVAVTIALALGVYSFFQAQAGQIQRERLLINIVSDTASSIDTDIIGWAYDDSASPTIVCYYIDIMNLSDTTRKYTVTVLPLRQQSNGLYVPTGDISLVPVDQDTPGDGVNTYYFSIEDSNGDGLLDVIGSGGSTIYLDSIPPCQDWRGNPSLTAGLQAIAINPSSILMSMGPPSLSELALSYASVNLQKQIPALEIQLDPKAITTLLIVVAVDDWDQTGEILPPPPFIHLVVLAEFEGNYYLATAFKLPPEIG